MKYKNLFLFLTVGLLFSCSNSDNVVDRTYENGMEVVLNHEEPYAVEGQPSTFSLERLFSIDTEDGGVAATGLVDTTLFDVDSEGNIYFLGPRSGENMVFKFGENGEFLHSFGRIGQGPGEIQQGLAIHVDQNDSIVITNGGNNRISIFTKDGVLEEEISTPSNIQWAWRLTNGNFLLFKSILDPASEFINNNPLVLCGPDLGEITELDRQQVPNPIAGERLKGTWHIFSACVSGRQMYSGFQERGYEIYVHDEEGQKIRTIRKESSAVPVPQSHKDEFMDAFSSPIFDDIRGKIYFPANMPAYLAFISDEKGRLYVMTYEQGENPGEFLFDIFTPEGVFVGRTGLRVLTDENGLHAEIRNNRFYSLLEKESGYKELVVSRMVWE